jgi:hypothetical protein
LRKKLRSRPYRPILKSDEADESRWDRKVDWQWLYCRAFATKSQKGVRNNRQKSLGCEKFASARPELMKEAYVQRIIGHHTTPREAGRVFAQTRPKLAAYTHIVQLASELIPPPTLDDIVAETRETYDGPLIVGEDLMAFEIGEAVSVRRLQPSSPATGGASIA